MTDRAILTFLAVLMIIYELDKQSRVSTITLALTSGILLSWTGNPILITMGLGVHSLSVIGCVLYGLLTKKVNLSRRIGIVVIGFFTVVSNLSMLLHLPHAGATKALLIILLISYIFLLFRKLSNEKEFSFVTILSVDLFLRFISLYIY